MTQAQLQRSLGLYLTPMQVPEAAPDLAAIDPERVGILEGSSERVGGTTLLVRPGQRGELVINLSNSGDRPLQVFLQVEGDFPAAWYSLTLETAELDSRQGTTAVMFFDVPANFFERYDILPAAGPQRLDYRLHLRAIALEGTSGRQLQETAILTVSVRPPSLYLNFVPNLYREVDFIGRLLALFEQAFEPAVHTLNAMWAHLDPLTAPEALLPFLAEWVGWPLDARWSIPQQRQLIHRALEIYRWRGTRRGLRLYLHLYTSLPLRGTSPDGHPFIEIQDRAAEGLTLGKSRMGVNAIVGGGRPFHFSVILRPPPDLPLDEALVRTIIEQEKPAFCTYELSVLPGEGLERDGPESGSASTDLAAVL